jgi:DNA gyrase subunit A
MVYTQNGYIKRTDPSEYKSQKRGGVGVVDLDTKDDDSVTHFLTADSHSNILFFSDMGRVYQTKMYDLPEGRRATKGKSIKNFLPLTEDEKITSILPVPKGKDLSDISLLFVTQKGVVKRTSADAFEKVRANGMIAIGLKDTDQLLSVRFARESEQVMMVTQNGQSIRCEISGIRTMGRSASGVRGISLKKDDLVVGIGIIHGDNNESTKILVITENGYGKKTFISEYKIQNRGGSGIKTLNVTTKTGKLVGARIVSSENNELIAMSQKSQVIRIQLDSVPRLGRATQGVRIMKLREKDSVASFTLI